MSLQGEGFYFCAGAADSDGAPEEFRSIARECFKMVYKKILRTLRFFIPSF